MFDPAEQRESAPAKEPVYPEPLCSVCGCRSIHGICQNYGCESA